MATSVSGRDREAPRGNDHHGNVVELRFVL